MGRNKHYHKTKKKHIPNPKLEFAPVIVYGSQKLFDAFNDALKAYMKDAK